MQHQQEMSSANGEPRTILLTAGGSERSVKESPAALSSGGSKGLTQSAQSMLSVSPLNIISSHETSFSSLARGSSCCWESGKSLYLLLHTPALPASGRTKPRSPGAAPGPQRRCWHREEGARPGAADGLGLEFRDQALAEGWEESLKENPLPPCCTAEGFPSPSPKQGAGCWGIASSSELRVRKAQSAPARL